MVVAQNKLIFAGSFKKVNSTKIWSNAAVSLTTGATITPWASTSDSFPIREVDPTGASGTSFTSVSTDGTQVYLTAFTYISAAANRIGTFEGRMAISATNGTLIWLNDCVGDSYDSFPIGQVLYSASHMHGCGPRGFMPDYPRARTYYHAAAETTYKTTANAGTNGGAYPSYNGQPGSTILNWFPTFTTGTATGMSQAGWSVTGNSSYVAYAGEFTKVNGVAQQGIVRFVVKDLAPNKQGPRSTAYKAGYSTMGYPADANGNSSVRVYMTGDPDNTTLTYELYRKNGGKLVGSKVMQSQFWKAGSVVFTDTGVAPGTSLDYNLVVKDPFGNQLPVNNTSVFNDTDTRIVYAGSGWSSVQSRADNTFDFARGLHQTTTKGASFSFTFYGNSVKLIGEKAYNRGNFTVSVDGAATTTHSAYDAGILFQQTMYEKTGLGFGKHTIKVTNADAGKYLNLDAIYVPQDNVVDDNAKSDVAYRTPSNWTTRLNNTTNYGGGIHYTKVNGEYVTFTFTGTSVALMSEKNVDRGNMTISIDGGAPVTVSTYASSSLKQQIVYTKTGLSSGTHTIRITKASGTYMDVDAVFSR